MTGEASVAEGRETPISCPSCGGHVHVIIVLSTSRSVRLLPCDHVVTQTQLLGRNLATAL